MSHVPRISTLQRSTVTVHMNSDALLIEVDQSHQITIVVIISSTHVLTNAHGILTLKFPNDVDQYWMFFFVYLQYN